MEIGYTNYTNLDACFSRPYQCGDRLVRGYSGTIVTDRGEPIEAIAERLFTRHNHDDRPDGELVRRCRSATSSSSVRSPSPSAPADGAAFTPTRPM